jgi:hypothetical protein
MAVTHSQSHAQAYVQAPEMTVFSTTSYKHWKTLHTMLVTTLFRLEAIYSSYAQVCVRLSVVSNAILYLYLTILGY